VRLDPIILADLAVAFTPKSYVRVVASPVTEVSRFAGFIGALQALNVSLIHSA
jgi:hypothetical protein